MVRVHSGLPIQREVPRLRSGFRHAAQTPGKRLKFESIRAYQLHKKAFTAELAEFAEKILENLFCPAAVSWRVTKL